MTAANGLEPEVRNGLVADENVHDDTETDDIAETVRYRITSHGADLDIAGLVRRINDDSIFVPDFQRSYVWTAKQASQFVESLLLDLPVPGIFLTVEPETKRMMVIDGNQRLKTLQFFYAGEFDGNPNTGEKARRFALQGVDTAFEGKTYADLRASDRRQLDDSLLHATITRQLYPEEGMSSVFHLFHRLNSSGQWLVPHEIRQAVFRGSLMDSIRDLNENPDWRAVFGPRHRRQKDQELILRFWALHRQSDAYRQPMLGFLNDFAEKYRNSDGQFIKDGKDLFSTVIEQFYNALGREAFRTERRRQLNAALFDSMAVGLARRIAQHDGHPSPDAVRAAHQSLLADSEYRESVSIRTSRETAVRTRIAKSVAAFGEA